MNELLILIMMVFAGFVDDFYLQNIRMTNLKQKDWWKDNVPDVKYKYDYIIVLFIHSFSWSFMILLPWLWFYGFNFNLTCFVVFVCNIIIHSIIDDLKANRRKLDLIQDQILHIGQIVITWLMIM